MMNKIIVVLLMLPMVAMGQDAPFECDNNYGECGTPEMSGGGNAAGGGSILINNTDLGDTYQTADDYDDDGVEDSYDNCPRARNSAQFDSDGDGVGDICDNCRDTHNLNQWNLDGDALGDLCDSDMDGDSVLNNLDNCSRVYNQAQFDIDDDGEGDACDNDIDNDGLVNDQDPCPMLAGDETTESVWCAPDVDGDKVPDYGINADNCPGVYNPHQKDTDTDGTGDACDPDLDGDTVLNLMDNCVSVFNVDQEDTDRDGRGDVGCDDRFCFVVFGDEANCLDPKASFKVYSPSVSLATSETVNLRLFINRENQAVRYTWTIVKRPNRSRTTIINPMGSITDSSLFESVYDQSPTFSPDQPGAYTLSINVQSVFDIETSEASVIAQHEVTLQVEGPAREHGSVGCNTNPGSSNPLGLLWLSFFVGLMYRSYRCRG
jgi:hypothetical protein